MISVVFSTIALCFCIFNLLVYMGFIKIPNENNEKFEEQARELSRVENLVKTMLKRKVDL